MIRGNVKMKVDPVTKKEGVDSFFREVALVANASIITVTNIPTQRKRQ
jgi:hypothetical protein